MAFKVSMYQPIIKPQSKLIRDNIHGMVELNDLVSEIINSSQFQRLRDIYQLGGTCFAYSTGDHKRYEHAIGTYHLTSRLLKNVYHTQPNLEWCDSDRMEKDILCVEVAALCLDLGQGPFSSVWEDMFVPRMFSKKDKMKHISWSARILDEIVKNLDSNLLTAKEDIPLIKSLIHGYSNDKKNPYLSVQKKIQPWRHFIYEIVSNSETKVDANKWDYLVRDGYYLGSPSFDVMRFLLSFRVAIDPVDGRSHFALQKTEVYNLILMFQLRHHLERTAYQHPITNAVEEMIFDGFKYADKFLKISNRCSPDASVEDYLSLSDHLFWQIVNSNEGALKQSKAIFKRILSHELYHLIGIVRVEDIDKNVAEDIHIFANEADIAVRSVCFTYGNEKKNPLLLMYFYRKSYDESDLKCYKLKAENLPMMLHPMICKETELRFYCKHPGRSACDACKTLVLELCKKNNLE